MGHEVAKPNRAANGSLERKTEHNGRRTNDAVSRAAPRVSKRRSVDARFCYRDCSRHQRHTDQNESWKYGTVILDFGDCYRRVSFDFDMSETEPRRQSLKKINLLAEVVNAVRDAIEKEVESRNARTTRPKFAISNSAK